MEKYFKAGTGTLAVMITMLVVLAFVLYSYFGLNAQIKDAKVQQMESEESLRMSLYMNDTLQRYIYNNFGQIDPDHPVMFMGRSNQRFPGNSPRVSEPLDAVTGVDSLRGLLLDSLGKGSFLTVMPDGVFRVQMSNGFLYDANSDVISETGQARLDRIAPVLQRAAGGFVIVVQGHTDDKEPQPGSGYPDSWSLSYNRAFSVVKYLTEQKQVPSSALVVEACGKFFPTMEQTTEMERAINRRIEIWLIPRNR